MTQLLLYDTCVRPTLHERCTQAMSEGMEAAAHNSQSLTYRDLSPNLDRGSYRESMSSWPKADQEPERARRRCLSHEGLSSRGSFVLLGKSHQKSCKYDDKHDQPVQACFRPDRTSCEPPRSLNHGIQEMALYVHGAKICRE
jgi:hypothetical protein